MTINAALFSSATDQWETPQWFFDYWNRRFKFTLDAAALPENAKCKRYFTPEDDGLAQDWSGETVWLNPPYGRDIGKWMKKAHAAGANSVVVCLVPSRTDTQWWHRYVMWGATEIWFIEGRLKFGDGRGTAPFPSAVVVFAPPEYKWPRMISGLKLNPPYRETSQSARGSGAYSA